MAHQMLSDNKRPRGVVVVGRGPASKRTKIDAEQLLMEVILF